MISVVIPSYNRMDSTLALLADLYQQQGVKFEVIVTDDCSSDGTAEAIATKYPQVMLLRNEANEGPCVSRNRGVRSAKGDIIVGFDSDVSIPDRSLLKRIKQTFNQHPNISTLALRILASDGETDDGPRWCHPAPMQQYADIAFITDYFSGTGYAFRREAMLRAGLFPELLYMHHEEVELAYRTMDAGGDILYCPNLALLHHPHVVANRSRIESFYHPRNQVLLAVGMFPWRCAFLYLMPRVAFNFYKALRCRELRTFFSALADAFRLMPCCLKNRRPLRTDTLQKITQIRHKLKRGRASITANLDVNFRAGVTTV